MFVFASILASIQGLTQCAGWIVARAVTDIVHHMELHLLVAV
jgi:hypothetical protein